MKRQAHWPCPSIAGNCPRACGTVARMGTCTCNKKVKYGQYWVMLFNTFRLWWCLSLKEFCSVICKLERRRIPVKPIDTTKSTHRFKLFAHLLQRLLQEVTTHVVPSSWGFEASHHWFVHRQKVKQLRDQIGPIINKNKKIIENFLIDPLVIVLINWGDERTGGGSVWAESVFGNPSVSERAVGNVLRKWVLMVRRK